MAVKNLTISTLDEYKQVVLNPETVDGWDNADVLMLQAAMIQDLTVFLKNGDVLHVTYTGPIDPIEYEKYKDTFEWQDEYKKEKQEREAKAFSDFFDKEHSQRLNRQDLARN